MRKTGTPPRFPVFLALFPLLLALGCGRSGPEETPALAQTDASPPRRGGTLRLALEAPGSLDPALADDVYEATVVSQVFSGLVQLDANLNVIPDLAESWTVSPDQRIFRFTLRPTARYHHGTRVTADDVVFSFTRLFDRSQIPPGIIQDYLNKVDGVEDFAEGRAPTIRGLEAIDPGTVEIRLARPYPSFLSVLTMDQAKIVPRDEVQRVGNQAFGEHPVGSGPFCFVNRDDTQLTLAAFEGYSEGRAYLDTVRFYHDPEKVIDWRKNSFLTRKLDAINVREDALPELLQHEQYRVMRRPELSVQFLGFNTKHPILKDARVRRAIAMSMDRDALRTLAGAGYTDATGIIPPGIPGYTPESKVIPRDIAGARALLAEAGYDETHPLKLPMMTISQTAYGQASDSIMVASLAQAGIQLELKPVSYETFDEAIVNRTATLIDLGWIADLPDPDSFLYTLFISDGASNLFGYSNPEVDALLEAGNADPDQVGRLARYREAEAKILADAPMIPLFNVINVFALQPEVRGVELSPFGLCSVPMERIWIAGKDKPLNAGL